MQAMNTHDAEVEGKPSASGFDADFRCLGKRHLEKQLPREPDTAIQKRGSGIHKALETSDLSELSASDQITASRCMFAEAELVHEFDFEGADTLWEKRWWDVGEDLEPLWSARLDVVHLDLPKRRAMVNDHKTGWGIPVPIESNWQIRGQACLVALHEPVAEVVTALVHPHHPDSLYQVKTFSLEEIEVNLVTIRRNVALIERDDQPRTPNKISCHFCRAKRICPEYQAQVKELQQSIADEVEDKGFTAIIRRTPAERGQHVSQLKQLEDHIGEIIEQYEKLAKKDPAAIDGWRLVKSYNRIVTNEGKAISVIEKELGRKAVEAALQFSLSGLEEFVEKTTKPKKAAKEKVEALLRKHDLLKFKPKKEFLKEKRS
jgi:hypothetical protein